MRRPRVPTPSPRAIWVVWLVAAVLVLALFGWLVYTVLHQGDRVKHAETAADSANVAAQDNGRTALQAKRAAKALAQQVRNLGGTPVVAPSDIPGPSKVTVPVPGIPGLRGPRGFPGRDSTIPGPRGAAGRDGQDGQKGADSTVPGPTGADGPQGPPGADGAPGRDGVDGAPGRDGVDGAPGRDGVDGKDGTAVPGTYTCPTPSEFVHGFTIAPDGTLTLDCVDIFNLIITGNSGN